MLAWTFGVFIAFILVVSFGLLFWRLPLLRARSDLESFLSREFAFILNNWILLVMALFVLGATLWPTISEYVGTRVTIGPPFFERVMVPLGLALLLLMGVGPLLAWRKTSTRSLQQQFLVPIVVGIGDGPGGRGAPGSHAHRGGAYRVRHRRHPARHLVGAVVSVCADSRRPRSCRSSLAASGPCAAAARGCLR